MKLDVARRPDPVAGPLSPYAYRLVSEYGEALRLARRELSSMAAPLAAPQAPARTRTNLHVVVGDSQRWGVSHDSPLVTSLPFLSWQTSAAGARRTAHRLALVGVFLPAARKAEADELRRMRTRMLLTRHGKHAPSKCVV